MTFDPEQLPLKDFGLACRGCGYPLANLTRFECPECGLTFELADYIPEGAMPVLLAGGKRVRWSPEVAEVLTGYHIPHGTLVSGQGGLLPGMREQKADVTVPRDRFFEAVDLMRRLELGEPMPPPPPPPEAGEAGGRADDWPCPGCGEANPPTFELCWACGLERP